MVKIKMLMLMVSSLRDSAVIVGVVCISSQASPGREKYTGGVCREGIQKGIQGGGGKINSQ